jgi:hypothetical protein
MFPTQAAESKASTRSSNFEAPSVFDMQTTPMALHSGVGQFRHSEAFHRLNEGGVSLW